MDTVGLLAYGEMGLPALKSLIRNFSVLWIVTPPQEKTDSPLAVEVFARKKGIKIFQTNSNSEIKEIIGKSRPKAVVIATYNKIIPADTLKLSKFINVHHGDLPRWRGRANINWAIILGRKEIGLTIHQMIPQLDAGPIYKQYLIPITDKDTVATVYGKVNKILENQLGKIISRILAGDLKGEKQKGLATYCCTRLPEDGLIDWNKSSLEIDRLIRAVTKPYPGAFTFFEGKKMFIWTGKISKQPRIFEGRIPGRVVGLYPDGVEVLTGDSSIIIKNITYEDKEKNARDVIKSVKKTLDFPWRYGY